MARNRFMTPHKGTKARDMILLLMRPQGLTSVEAMERGLIRSQSSLTGFVARLEYECGFDIRVVGYLPRTKVGRRIAIRRIVGRHRWNGPYRSFLAQYDEAA